jgi:hypothetical protein
MSIKTAVICEKYETYKYFLKKYQKNPEKYTWVRSYDDVSGKYFNGYQIALHSECSKFNWPKHEYEISILPDLGTIAQIKTNLAIELGIDWQIEECIVPPIEISWIPIRKKNDPGLLNNLILMVELNRKMTVQECLDYLDEKGKILSWLIQGQGIHGLPLSSVDYLTKERICELYNMQLSYFENEK